MSEKPLMACGCAANARKMPENIPSCVIHECTEIAKTTPSIEGRTARCSCNAQKPSSLDLAFFEYRGDGSRHATELCKCGYTEAAHKLPHISSKCQQFQARGPHEFDSYYCGCRGWD